MTTSVSTSSARSYSPVTIVGAGLAGCEAAWQLAERGIDVVLHDQKPHKRTPAQTGDALCELVCSNSMRGASLTNAVGLIKEELRRAGSLVLEIADLTRVPAGGALAVDRDRFSAEVTKRIQSHPRIRFVSGEITAMPTERPLILATGPLTGDALAKEIASLVGAEHLAYYDAIAPIISADSVDREIVFAASRQGRGHETEDDQAYLNCPFTKDQYQAFVKLLVESEKVAARPFEDVRYFEGCLPVELMAERGERTLAFGPMKPIGLTDPKTGRWPYAVVQLRPEDHAKTAYNLVGFQTRMTYGEQARVFRTIPGLEKVEFLRFGSVHRNTFIDAPKLLDDTMQLKSAPGVFLAGQITGVEGYVESAAGGFLCALLLAQRLQEIPLDPPPATTALGALRAHLAKPNDRFQPSNVTWALFPPPDDLKLRKPEKYEVMAARALEDLGPWLDRVRI